MSGDDVHRNDMDGTFEFDDEAAEALLAGRGAGIDPALSELVGDIRTHFSTAIPAVGLELSTFFGEEPQRFVRSRARLGAKVAAAVAACLAATSGLAVAGALPGPVQHAVSRAAGGLGVHVPDQHHGSGQPRVLVGLPEETTTTAGGTASTTTQPDDDSSTPPNGTHGAEVSGVAHDPSTTGCAHGAAVAGVASGTAKTPACVKSSTTTTTTTDLGPVTTTTQPGHQGHGPPATTPGNHGLDVVQPTDPPGRSGTGG
jgi:hypothetical protein